MSALGHKRKNFVTGAMSALPPNADKQQTFRYVRFVPILLQKPAIKAAKLAPPFSERFSPLLFAER
jgi:hypothetical protein